MSRAFLVLANDLFRAKAKRWIDQLPPNSRITFQKPKRTLPQNDRMWAMLTDIAEQKTHFGRKYPADGWKLIFMSACGRETQFIPALDGQGFIPWGQSSSDLSVQEMTDLIEFMFAWGTQNGVIFHDDKLGKSA